MPAKGKILTGKGPIKKPVPGKKPITRGPVNPGKQTLPKRGGVGKPKGGMVNPKRKDLTGSTFKTKQARGASKLSASQYDITKDDRYTKTTTYTGKGEAGSGTPLSPKRPGLDKMSPQGTTTGKEGVYGTPRRIRVSQQNGSIESQVVYGQGYGKATGADYQNAARQYAKNQEKQLGWVGKGYVSRNKKTRTAGK